MSLLQRQVNFVLARGVKAAIADAVSSLWRFRDAEPRDKLVLQPGKWSGGSESVSGVGVFTLPFPTDYDPTNRLAVFLACDQPMKFNKFGSEGTVKGTRGTDDGDHKGIVCFQEILTAPVTLTGTLGVGVLTHIDYFAFEIPDLSLPASWKDGMQTTGVVP